MMLWFVWASGDQDRILEVMKSSLPDGWCMVSEEPEHKDQGDRDGGYAVWYAEPC